MARRVVERGVLEKFYIAILATSEVMAQHFLSHCLFSPSPSPYRVPINFSSFVRIFMTVVASLLLFRTLHSSLLTTLIYCLYPACRIAYSAALCAPRSQNSLPSRSSHSTSSATSSRGRLLQAPTPAPRSTPYPVIQWISGVLSERVKRPPWVVLYLCPPCVFMACIRTLLCQTKVYFRVLRILSLEGYRNRRSVLTLVTLACTIVRTMTLHLFRLQAFHDLKSPCPLFSSSKSVWSLFVKLLLRSYFLNERRASAQWILSIKGLG